MNVKKIIETYTRHNKRNKNVDIREIKRKIRNMLECNLGFLGREEGYLGYKKETYQLPTNWFVILELEEHSGRHIYERVTLRIEHFGEPISYPWHEGQLRVLIRDCRLRKIKNKQGK